MNRTIKHTWFYPHSPETVWDYLTKKELLAQWLMESDFEPLVGHKFQFSTRPRPGFDGTIYCEVLEIDPLKRLSYSWKGGPQKEKITLDSVVVWTMTAKDNGTELTLEHQGFKGMKNFLSYLIMNKGWEKILKRFGKNLNDAKK